MYKFYGYVVYNLTEINQDLFFPKFRAYLLLQTFDFVYIYIYIYIYIHIYACIINL